MRRIEYGRSRGEASGGGRDGLLNRGSRVRIPAPAPPFCASSADRSQKVLGAGRADGALVVGSTSPRWIENYG